MLTHVQHIQDIGTQMTAQRDVWSDKALLAANGMPNAK